ncbi:hypothetical protein LX64_03124 [Chitinophaga skermanii]|uniref:Uncharacterized protein n=1 Tax=Chitinophaga skermanii TaxID=331697 RepID=A0A327QKL1_9BACT|nr:hypothetical protein [Chitinophaga skermanii]RAJ04244.1 hypothetical protein LX64_03124 [Chitinophaga skermanii]
MLVLVIIVAMAIVVGVILYFKTRSAYIAIEQYRSEFREACTAHIAIPSSNIEVSSKKEHINNAGSSGDNIGNPTADQTQLLEGVWLQYTHTFEEGETHTFISQRLNGSKESWQAKLLGQPHIDLFYNPDDLSQFYFDIDELISF